MRLFALLMMPPRTMMRTRTAAAPMRSLIRKGERIPSCLVGAGLAAILLR